MRGGREINLDVTIGRLPEDGDTETAPEMGGSSEPSQAPLGLTVEPLTPEMADAAGVQGGVLVARVGQGPGADAGIRPRDIITEINRQQVRSSDDFRKAINGLPSDRAVSVRVVRDGRAIYLVMKP